MKLSEKKLNLLVDFTAGFLINFLIFCIAIFFTEITILYALLYSIINAFLMMVLLFPLLDKINRKLETKRRKYKLKVFEDNYQEKLKRRIELDKKFEALEKKEKILLEKFKFDWKLYRKYLKKKDISCVYHFTDKKNIKSIIENDGLYSLKSCREKGIEIPKPGGNELSHSLDKKSKLDDYIRLSFTPNHPMMYVAISDGRIKEPTILKIKSEVIYWLNSKYSDNNATNKTAKIGSDFKSLPLNQIEQIKTIDYYNCSEEFKKYYQAEILVKDKIPLKYIENIYDYIEK